MAAIMERTEVGIKKTGGPVTVPNSPVARLMYYFDCVCSCLEPDSDYEIRRLRDYKNYYHLSSDEEAKLLVLCLALSPDKLPIFIPTENIPGTTNQFLELSAVNTKMVVTDSVLVGGQRRRVQKVMMYTRVWLEQNYLNPIRQLTQPRSRPAITSYPHYQSTPYSQPNQNEKTNHCLHCLLTLICPMWIFVWCFVCCVNGC